MDLHRDYEEAKKEMCTVVRRCAMCVCARARIVELAICLFDIYTSRALRSWARGSVCGCDDVHQVDGFCVVAPHFL